MRLVQYKNVAEGETLPQNVWLVLGRLTPARGWYFILCLPWWRNGEGESPFYWPDRIVLGRWQKVVRVGRYCGRWRFDFYEKQCDGATLVKYL